MSKKRVSRRLFLAGLAGGGIACGESPSPQRQNQQPPDVTAPLTVYFTGLSLFSHDRGKKEMNVGLLDYNHETVVIARKADVDKAGQDITSRQYQSWNPVGLAINRKDLTHWKTSQFAMSVTSSDSLSVSSPFKIFPLTDLAKKAPELTSRNCQSLLTFRAGQFVGEVRTHSCNHDSVLWEMVKNLGDPSPIKKDVELRDTVKYTVTMSKGSFVVDGTTTINLTGRDVKLWVMQLDKAPGTKSPREIVHCTHYYDLVPGYSEAKFYPRRAAVPETCKAEADVDPIYCTPGE